MSRPVSAAGTNVPANQAPKPLASKNRSMSPSNISLFVSNLRILDLDLKPDWPDITIKTFDTKDALQNQKKRISCVEWALYRLFEIWDRETTRDKLQPFFPPLEPIQSLNLRAALFRCLNELKKNDVLGREATLRKTMLDDCKGEKFEEVLLLFSVAVVRKQILLTRRKQPFSVGKNLSIAKNPSKSDLGKFGPISLAYRASLAKTLHGRASLDHTLDDFRKTLQGRRDEYQQRHAATREIQASNKNGLSPDADAAIRRELRQNWTGSIDGCESLLAGAKAASADAYMDSDFDSLWRHFRQGTTPKVPSENVSLLETLQSRVSEQNERLRLWKAYREIFNESTKQGVSTHTRSESSIQITSAAAHGLDIFNKHTSLQAEQDVSQSPGLSASGHCIQYGGIVSGMNQALAEVIKKKRTQPEGPGKHTMATPAGGIRRSNRVPKQMPVPVFLASKELKEDLFSPLKRPLPTSSNSTPITLRDQPRQPYSSLSRTQSQPVVTPHDTSIQRSAVNPNNSIIRHAALVEETASDWIENDHVASPSPQYRDYGEQTETAGPLSADLSSAATGYGNPAAESISSLEGRLDRIDLGRSQRETPIPDSPDHSPNSPSDQPTLPIKQESPERPSLSERARISMTFRSSSNTTSPTLPMPSDNETTPGPNDPLSRHTSLADRARNSITQSLTQPTNAGQTSTRRSTRERPHSSFFPSTTFSTPAKPSRASLGHDTTPRDKLFDQDAEYASVFKSRPKIAMSPVLSPALGIEDLDFDGRDVDGDESMVGLQSSPLGKYGV